MTAYYNENEPYAAEWLRNLVAERLIAPGYVDERDVRDVTPADLDGFDQCHFFAGIGGWSRALRLAGWPDDRPVWTGSCPCQPFSAAGKREGFADERHLWPSWHWLIQECRPPVVLGEQVASGPAKDWLDLVSADLEGLGYAFGAASVPACGVGAPQLRQRAWFVARAEGVGWRPHDLECERWGRERPARPDDGDVAGPLADRAGDRRREECALPRGVVTGDRSEGRPAGFGAGSGGSRPGPTNGFWRASDWLLCRDGKWRPVEPGTSPLADGIPNRVGKLRAYGNAVVPPEAAAFVTATGLLDLDSAVGDL